MINLAKWGHFSPDGLGQKATARGRCVRLPELLVLNPAMGGKQDSFN